MTPPDYVRAPIRDSSEPLRSDAPCTARARRGADSGSSHRIEALAACTSLNACGATCSIRLDSCVGRCASAWLSGRPRATSGFNGLSDPRRHRTRRRKSVTWHLPRRLSSTQMSHQAIHPTKQRREAVMRADNEDESGRTDETARPAVECDRIEVEFAKWFEKTAARLTRRRADRSGMNAAASDPSLSRGLLLLWATSPVARASYSDEERRGLIAAADSMTDRVFLTLLCRLVEHSRNRSGSAAAA